MENPFKEVLIDETHKAKIGYANRCSDPREDSNIGKMTFRPNKQYKFPDEIYFDFLGFDEGEEDAVKRFNELEEKYHVFFIDVYIHGGYSFSLEGEGMQCQFDTARKAGLIAIPKEYNGYDLEEWSESNDKDKGSKVTVDRDEAIEIARSEIEDYHKYFNGEQYECAIYKKFHYKCVETGEIEEEREFITGSGVYYDEESLLDWIKQEYDIDEFLEEDDI